MHNICNVEISPDSYPNSAFEYPSNPDDDVTLMMQLVLNTGVGGVGGYVSPLLHLCPACLV